MANSGKQLNIWNIPVADLHRQRNKPYGAYATFRGLNCLRYSDPERQPRVRFFDWFSCSNNVSHYLFLCRPALMQMFLGIVANATGRTLPISRMPLDIPLICLVHVSRMFKFQQSGSRFQINLNP